MPRKKNKFITPAGPKLWQQAKKIIPGGNGLLSKRSEMFLPDLWPAYYQKAKGITVWDLDGRPFIDMSIMGVGACVLGYADPDVNQAVKNAIDLGSMCTLNPPEEVELAKILLKKDPWAGQVRFARTGGEAMAIAVRIARAWSARDKIAFCGYHGWHDWYLAANLTNKKNLDGQLLPGLDPLGVPRALRGSVIPFKYNDLSALKKIMANHQIGVVVMEPVREHWPDPKFLPAIRQLANKHRAVLIFDEITSGWRMTAGGIHKLFHIHPDIVVYGKAMSNGFPMAAILGRTEIMAKAQQTFISSTHWTERVGPVAALATVKKFQKQRVADHLIAMGKLIQQGWADLAKKHDLNIRQHGIPPLAGFTFDYGPDNQALQTLFTQEMLKRGYLAGKTVYVSAAHQTADIKKYLRTVDHTWALLKKAIDQREIRSLLDGPIAHSGFARLT